MKILHTSDWHIGVRLYNSDLETEHRLFFDWLIQTLINEKIDILIVAGDIFDVAFPSNSALKLYYQVLTKIQTTSCKNIFITGGNHDSVSTLNAPQNILQYLNIYVIGGATENIDDLIFKINDETGKPEIIICAVPFLRDKDIRKSIAGENFNDRQKAISSGIAEYYNSIAEKVKDFSDSGIPIVATGHFFVNDTDMSSEEKEFYIGGLQQISYKSISTVFDYFALGHIHRPQKIANLENVRYSGSPVSVSFSEINQQKSVVIVDFEGKKPKINLLEVPKFRNIVKFQGTYNEIISKITDYKDDAPLKAWGDLYFTDIYEPNYQRKVEKFIETVKNIEILNYRINFIDNNSNEDKLLETTKSLNEMTANEIFDKLLDKNGVSSKQSLKNTFNELISQMTDEV